MTRRLLFILLLALVLTIIPFPLGFDSFRPPWVLLFVLYVQCYCPRYFNTMAVFLLGLCLDALLSTLMGEHAFALLLTSSLALNKSKPFRHLGIGQQMGWIGLFCMIYQLILVLVDAFLGYSNGCFIIVASAITGLLFWPWVKLLGEVSPMRERARI